MSIAFLVYEPERKRRKNNSFDGNDNIGALVIIDALKKKGHEVGFCAPETAHKHDIVLISLTSTYDIFAFYKAVALKKDWQKKERKFKVICGGFGMQNPTTIRNFIDYAVFGRAENFICDMIDCILGGGVFEHESVMVMPEIYNVKIAQVDKLYQSDFFNEKFIGCPNKCKFCHYTWARKRLSGQKTYYQDSMQGSPELLFKDIVKIKHKIGKCVTAIDGFSEKIRLVYGKKITDNEITTGVQHIGGFGIDVILRVYNIGNMPNENQNDRDSLYDILKKIDGGTKCVFILQTTPFRPSIITPMQYAQVCLLPNFNKLKYKIITKKGEFKAIHSFTNEGNFSQLKTVIVERATCETDKLFHTICFSKRLNSLKSDRAVNALRSNFDLMPYLRRYDPDEDKHPGWFLESYMPRETLKKAFLWTEKQF